ncbi:hypothetical protein BH23BAC1_BH23BAC1_38130 [soil metagenome]
MNRRKSLKTLALGAITPAVFLKGNTIDFNDQDTDKISQTAAQFMGFKSNWQEWPDMAWVGPDYWGNRLQDWSIKNGKVECTVYDVNRSLHCLTCQLGNELQPFETNITISVNPDLPASRDNFAGFRLGAKGKFEDYRSAAVFGEGIEAGITTEGVLFIGQKLGKEKIDLANDIHLKIEATPSGDFYQITLSARDRLQATTLAVMSENISHNQLTGNIALVSHVNKIYPQATGEEDQTGSSTGNLAGGAPFSFSSWEIRGPKIVYQPGQAFGPICFAQYTLHHNILKLTAQLAPVDTISGHRVILQIRQNGTWKTLHQTKIDPLSRTSNFRIENWNAAEETPYRVRLELPLLHSVQTYDYEGSIASEPLESEQVKVAVFSCNCDYGFPDADIAPHIAKHKPHLAVFLGDQFYESTGGFGIQTAPLEKASLDYLRKWYMFGWSYREIFRHIPVAIIPDDHDVYHGNVWGEGGKNAPTDEGWGYAAQDKGGYKMPPEWVNMVQKTQTSHLPDPFDATPVKQGIGVYYTNWNYGGISFAILEDRKFKTAPKNVLPRQAKVENGFIQNPDFDIREFRHIEADLLGDRQLNFLNNWLSDWKEGVEMKAVLSQTNFCTVATLPKGSISDQIVPKLPVPEPGEYVKGDTPTVDMDSNGWPQKGRDEALKLIRKAFAFHIAGDQHLASMVHYGVEEFSDAGYAFAGPALNNLWPRRWWPEKDSHQPLPGRAPYTGHFLDGFGNHMTVHAVANPHKTGIEPSIIYDRATGYGIVTFNKAERSIITECWPRYADPLRQPQGQYQGWPITIKQEDNYGRKASAWLPEIQVKGLQNPVVEILDEKDGELVYSLRIKGSRFKPKVFSEGNYTVRISEPDKGIVIERKNISAQVKNSKSLVISV